MSFRGRGKFFKTFAGLADDHYILKHRDFVAVLVEDGKHRSFDLRLLLEGRLVGFVAEKDIADLDAVTNLFLELGDDAALHGLALLGHYYDLCHYVLLV